MAFRTLPPDRYRDFRPEGHGGMGIVYWAIDSDLNREVAFKIVRPPTQDTDDAPAQPLGLSPPPADSAAALTFDALKTRLLQEAWVTAAMAHPGIVPVFEVGQTPEGVPYYTMRYVRGKRTLTHAIEEARTVGPEARLALLEPFLKVCDAIAYAHARGIVHRDLKPDNVALGEFGEVVVLDWGLAKMGAASEVADDRFRALVEAWRGEATGRSGAVGMGTLGYMAPEALRIGGEVDARSDVYSLGAILFRALTGRLPHDAATAGELMEKVLGEDPPSADVLDPAVPSALSVLCGRCLSRDRSRRPADAAAVGRAVRTLQAEWAQERQLERVLHAARAAVGEAEALRGAALHAALARAEERVAEALALRADDEETLRVRGRIETLRAGEARRTRRAARNLVAVPLLLVLAGGGTWAYLREKRHSEAELRDARALAEVTQRHVEETRRHAEQTRRNLLRAQVLGLADASAEARARDPMRALLLAHAAVRKMLDADESIPLATDRLHAALAASAERARLPTLPTRATECGLVPARASAWCADEHGLRWWNLRDEKVDVVFPGAVRAVGLSPDGRVLVTASPLGDVAVRAPPASDVLAAAHAHDAGISAVAVAEDGTFATASDDGTVRVWSARAEPLARLELGEKVRSVAFADGGALVFTVAAGGARLWSRDGATVAEFPRQGAAGEVLRGVCSASGRRVATQEADATWIWAERDRPPGKVSNGAWPLAFADESGLVVSWDDGIRLHALDGSVRVAYESRERGSAARPTAWARGPQGELIVAAGGRLQAWRPDGVPRTSFPAHEHDVVASIAWDVEGSDGPWTIGTDGTARRWNLDGLEAPAPTDAEIAPDASRPSFGSLDVRDGRVEVYDANRRSVRAISEPGVTFVGADFGAATGRVLAWGGSGEARVFGPGPAPVASWNDASLRIGGMREAPDGEHYILATGEGPRVWHPSAGRAPLLQGEAAEVTVLTFAEDRRHVLGFAKETYALHVWDYEGREEAVVRPPVRIVRARIAASGDRLLGVGADGVARAWFLDPRVLLGLAEARKGRDFTRPERWAFRTLLSEPELAPSEDGTTGD